MWLNHFPICCNHIRSNSLTFGLCCKCQLSFWEPWLVYFTIHTQGHTHADTNIIFPTTLPGLLLMPCLPQFLLLTHIITPNQPKRSNFPEMASLDTGNAYFGPPCAACWRKNTWSCGFCPSTEDSWSSTCSARPTFSNKLPQPKISRGLNWRTKKYCMRTCHRLSKSLTSAYYEKRHAVTNTAESSNAVFSLLPYKKIKMAAP